MMTRLLRLGIPLCLIALIALIATARLATRGSWVPPLPTVIGEWTVTEVPVSEEERSMLGSPRLTGFELTNPLQERIFGRIVATSSFDAFLPPLLFRFYEVTGEKALTLEGGGKALGQVNRQMGSELRVSMIAWVQRPDTSTSLLGVPSGSTRSPLGRFLLGSEAAFQENRSCLIRLFTIVHPADPSGAQARRNLLSAANAVRKALADGKPLAGAHGAEAAFSEGGKDIAYLADKGTPAGSDSAELLPLKTGNNWEFDATTEGGRVPEQVIVRGPEVVGGVSGIALDILRGGKLWRREVYQHDGKALRLLAFGDATSTRIVLSPPMALVALPVTEGGEVHWKGNLILKGQKLPTIGYSRVSARENIVAGAGRFAAYRVDSVLTIDGAKPTHFPAIRWLAPGIGFVRRGYADGGKPAVAELKRFTVK